MNSTLLLWTGIIGSILIRIMFGTRGLVGFLLSAIMK